MDMTDWEATKLEIFLPFKGDKLDITVKEIIPLGKIGFDHELCGKINISVGFYLEEIVRGILLMWQPRKSIEDLEGR